MEVKTLCLYGKICHVLSMTSRVTTYKIRNDLLVKSFLTVYAVKDTLELYELRERRLSHVPKHTIASMLRSNLQTSANVFGDELACVLFCCTIRFLVLRTIQQKVITYSRTDKTLLYTRKSINGMIDVEQLAMICIQIRADLRMNA